MHHRALKRRTRSPTSSGASRAAASAVASPLGTPLPHAPRPVLRVSTTARLLVAGQAPGIRVHRTGIPFNDPSGDRLRAWMGIDRVTFYDTTRIAIVPMGFCFPGHDAMKGDLPPRRECRATWHDEAFRRHAADRDGSGDRPRRPDLSFCAGGPRCGGRRRDDRQCARLARPAGVAAGASSRCRIRPGATAVGSRKIPGSNATFCRSSKISCKIT